MKIDIINLNKEVVGNAELNENIFDINIKADIISKVIKWQLAKRRSGSHKVKNRSEVNHTTAKPFRQKGTGRARQGMKGVAQMRGGGVVFGPLLRSHSFKVLKKVRNLALKGALAGKFKENNFFVLNELSISSCKTKDLLKAITKLDTNNALFISDDSSSSDFKKACANISNIDYLLIDGLNVYDIVKHDKIYITKNALDKAIKRLQ